MLLIEKLLKPFRQKTIGGDCPEQRGPLMTRWDIINTRYLRLSVHKFHRSDWDRAFHDHPWHFVTFLFSGGYFEHTPKGKFWRRRFSILFRRATFQHWVEIVKPVYTIVLRTKDVRDWGFITAKGWTHWKKVDFEKICE